MDPHFYFKTYEEFGTPEVSVDLYKEDYFLKEKESVFKRVWLNSGWRGADIPEVGSYAVLDVPLFESSILLIRTHEGSIKGFHNVCTHRGNRLVWRETGQSEKFICNFHNWTFDMQGKLAAAPGSQRIMNFDRACHGLRPINVDVWNDFIFINFDETPCQSLREFLGTWADDIDTYPFQELTLFGHYKAHLKANWKIVLDAFQEAYHGPFLHARSAPDIATSENPLLYALAIRFFGPHRLLSVPSSQQSIAYGRAQDLEGERTYKTSGPLSERLASFGKLPPAEPFRTENLPRGINITKSKEWTFDLNVVFPNWWVAIRGDHIHTYNFWPVSHNETNYEVRFYYAPARTVKEALYKEMLKVRVRNTLREDLSTVERIQELLGSGALSHFVLTDEEIGVKHNHFVIDTYIKEKN